jgi:hypothetical protein
MARGTGRPRSRAPPERTVIAEPARGYGSACLAGLGALLGTHADRGLRVAAP